MKEPVYIEYKGIRYEAVGMIRDMMIGVIYSGDKIAPSESLLRKCDSEESRSIVTQITDSVLKKVHTCVIEALREKADESNEIKEQLNECLRLICDIRGPLYDHDMHSWENKCDNIIAKYGSGKESK